MVIDILSLVGDDAHIVPPFRHRRKFGTRGDVGIAPCKIKKAGDSPIEYGIFDYLILFFLGILPWLLLPIILFIAIHQGDREKSPPPTGPANDYTAPDHTDSQDSRVPAYLRRHNKRV